MAYLRIANLKKNYYITREEKQEVLKGINVEFDRGEFVAVLGESGCGKSTLLNILAGLDYDYTGSLVLKKAFMKDFNEHDMDNYRKTEVGIIFQSYNLIPHMTALENVVTAMRVNGMSKLKAQERALELLKKVGIEQHSQKYPNQLSGGQKQRVAIARALSNNPEIILADEPTGNLDNESRDEIMGILKDIAVSGKLVVCVTHSEKVAKECTRILRMDEGIIVSDEKSKTYKTSKVATVPSNPPKNIKTAEIFRLSVRNIIQNLKRSLLVSLALSAGIASVVLMFALSAGIKSFISTELTSSMNRLQIDVTRDTTATLTFSSDDIKTLKALDGVSSVVESAEAVMSAQFKASGQSEFKTLLSLGSTFDGFTPTLNTGSVPSSDGEILISLSMMRNIFGNADVSDEVLLAKTITLQLDNSKEFTVCGVTEDDSPYFSAFITKKALNSLYSTASAPVNKVYVFATDVSYVSALVTDIGYLGFEAKRQDSTAEDMLSYLDMGTFVFAGISAVSLAVSAIMIFIVMYISVVERTKEIGVLRAIGSKRADVRKIFIFEAGTIGLIAGLIGVFVTYMIALTVNLTLASSFAVNFVSYNPLYYLAGIAVSVILSVLTCLGPSSVAAHSDPVEALRAE